MNLYQFAGNNGIGAWDASGLWWKVKRKGANTAIAMGCNDTVHNLAKKLRLDPYQYRSWLWAGGGSLLPASPQTMMIGLRVYRVPNTIVVYTAQRYRPPSPFKKARRRQIPPHYPVVAMGADIIDISIVNWFRTFATEWVVPMAESKGYKVVKHIEARNKPLFVSSWRTDGIYGYVFAGHGTPQGSMIVDLWGATPSGMTADPTEVSPPYKLAVVSMYACYSAKPYVVGWRPKKYGGNIVARWSDHAATSYGATFIGFTGAVSWPTYNMYEYSINKPFKW